MSSNTQSIGGIQGDGAPSDEGRAFVPSASSRSPASRPEASIPCVKRTAPWVIHATMGLRGGLFCFCPADVDADGEITAIITGLTVLSDMSPGRLIAIVHEDGQEAVEAFSEAHKGRLRDLASAIEARSSETGTGSIGEADESAVAKPDAQGPSA